LLEQPISTKSAMASSAVNNILVEKDGLEKHKAELDLEPYEKVAVTFEIC
jgi:hypothetical protein